MNHESNDAARPGCTPPAEADESATKLPQHTPTPDGAHDDAPAIAADEDGDEGADESGEESGEGLHRRRIRSFVTRAGRVSTGQRRALDELGPRYVVPYTAAPADWDATFGRQAPRVLEIGFGNGEALAWASEHDLDRDYIGVEVHGPGVGRLMNGLAERDASNVRIYKHDAVEVLENEIAPGSLSEARIWFPDPWHKKRHNKRRLVQPAFVALLASRMAPGGLLHLATDWEPYAEHMREVMEAAEGWRNRVGPGQSAERPAWRIETHFERRGMRLGHGVWDFLYEWHGATTAP